MVRAVSVRRGARVLDSYAARVRVVRLTPLAKRPTEIARLLDGILRDELHEAAGASALGPSLLQAVERFHWPRNLDELREYAPRLLALQRHGKVSAAARSLGITRQTLSQHMERVGVSGAI